MDGRAQEDHGLGLMGRHGPRYQLTPIGVAYVAWKERQMSEAEIENAVKASGATDNRLRPEDIDRVIKTKQFYVFPGSQTTVCCITLQNGFTTIGYSGCIDPANFRPEIGEKVAFENARQQIWSLEGYLKKEKMYQQETSLAGIRAIHALKDEPGAY